MATRGLDGAPACSSGGDGNGEGGGGGSSGGGEWIAEAAGSLQDARRGTGRPGSYSAATWRHQLARWHSTEQLGGAGGGRRPPCPWWAGWAGWAGFAWAPGKVFPFSVLSFLSFFFL